MNADNTLVTDIREHDDEPLLGLPEKLPQGERILWQGSPDRYAFMKHVLHFNKIVLWFAVVVVWRMVSVWQQTGGWSLGLLLTPLLALGLALGIVCLLGWLYSRSMVYTLTSRRVTMRFGLAVQITMNIPFNKILSADVSEHRNGTGNIALKVAPGARISHLVLWPNVRPWHWFSPQPMLCCISDVSTAAEVLTNAVTQAAKASTHNKEAPVTAEESLHGAVSA